MSCRIWRKAMSPKDRVLFVTTDSNCMHSVLVSSHTFMRYEPQYSAFWGLLTIILATVQTFGMIRADTSR